MGFSVLDGQTTHVTGAFADVATKTATLDLKRSLFVALASAVNPGATFSDCLIYVTGEPGGPTRVTYGYLSTILFGGDAGIDDVTLELDYGNPFPASWAASATVYVDFSIPYLVPGTAIIKKAGATLSVTGTLADLATGAVKPSITPPSALKIGGKDAYAVNTGVGLTPALSWSAPSLGASTRYEVNLHELDAAGNDGWVGELIVQGTSVTIPAGMLTSGSSYFVDVAAQTGGSITTPFQSQPSGGSASTVSGVFTP